MGPKIAVGLESTLDIVVTFRELKDFQKFSEDYDGGLSRQVKEGYEKVSEGSGGEMPVDGKKEEGRKLLELAEKNGAELSYRLGGNGAQEAATLERLGSKTIFLGNISTESISELSKRGQSFLDETEMNYAQTSNEYSPASYILQATDTNRYILSEGEGRRIDQLRDYLKGFPEIVEKIEKDLGGLDSLSLVGWHVVFGNGLSEEDFEMATRVLEDVREKTEAMMFTDGGGAGALDEDGKKKLCEIYSKFDIISVNEDEIHQITGENNNSGSRFDEMKSLLNDENELSSVWLHTPKYQATLTSDIPEKDLEKAQDLAALAGSYKVENADYPSYNDLIDYRNNRSHSDEGLEKVKEIKSKYDGKIGEMDLVVTPCYELEKFTSTVGAGDVSSAAYLYSLSKSKMKNK